MNKARRAQIEKIAEETDALQERLQALLDEEQEYFDNMPEGIHASEKGEKAEASIGSMDAAIEAFDEIKSQLEEAAQQ